MYNGKPVYEIGSKHIFNVKGANEQGQIFAWWNFKTVSLCVMPVEHERTTVEVSKDYAYPSSFVTEGGKS